MYWTDYVCNAAGNRLMLWEQPLEPPDVNEPEEEEETDE